MKTKLTLEEIKAACDKLTPEEVNELIETTKARLHQLVQQEQKKEKAKKLTDPKIIKLKKAYKELQKEIDDLTKMKFVFSLTIPIEFKLDAEKPQYCDYTNVNKKFDFYLTGKVDKNSKLTKKQIAVINETFNELDYNDNSLNIVPKETLELFKTVQVKSDKIYAEMIALKITEEDLK